MKLALVEILCLGYEIVCVFEWKSYIRNQSHKYHQHEVTRSPAIGNHMPCNACFLLWKICRLKVKWEQAAGFNELFNMIPLNLIHMVASELTALHRRSVHFALLLYSLIYMEIKVCNFWVLHLFLLLSAWYVPAKCSYQGRTWYIKGM